MSLTDKARGLDVAQGVEDGIEPAGIVDGLPEPHHGLPYPTPAVLSESSFGRKFLLFISRAGWQDEDRSQRRSREQRGLLEREDILERDLV